MIFDKKTIEIDTGDQTMKGIVEQYARGEFKVDRPAVAISVSKIELNIEAGTVYDGEFTVDSSNSCAVKLMVHICGQEEQSQLFI